MRGGDESKMNTSISFLFKSRNYYDIQKCDRSKISIKDNEKYLGCSDLICDVQYSVRQCQLPCFNYYWNNISGKKETIIHLGNTQKEGSVKSESICIDILSGQLVHECSEAVCDAYVQYREIGHSSRKISYAEAERLLANCKSPRYFTGHTLEEYTRKNFEIYLSSESQEIRAKTLSMHNAMINNNAPLPNSSNRSPDFDEVNNNQSAINLLSIYNFDQRYFFFIRNTTQGYRFLSIADISDGFNIMDFSAIPTEEEIANLFNHTISAMVCDRLLSDVDATVLNSAVKERNQDNRQFNRSHINERCLFILLNDDGTGEYNRMTRPADSMFFRKLDTLSKHTYG